MFSAIHYFKSNCYGIHAIGINFGYANMSDINPLPPSTLLLLVMKQNLMHL